MSLTKLAAASLLFASTLAGCAIHSQAPIKQVAYDFSDHDFYDVPYAASPLYEASAPAAQRESKSAPVVMVIFQDAQDAAPEE